MFCSSVKEFLLQKGIKYTERNVTEDKSVLDELKKLGVMTTPVIVINGEVVIGFDQSKLEELLEI